MFYGKLAAFFYFIIISVATTCAVCTLWVAAPMERPAAAAAAATAGCHDVPGDPPQITRIEPDSLAIGDNNLDVAVIGCNLAGGARVRFNGVERSSNPAGDNQLNVPLLASDFAGAANIAVSVETMASPGSAGRPLESNLRNLRITPASDVKLAWSPVGTEHAIAITAELRLILLVLFVGALSASVFGLNSFVNYAGEEKLTPNWLWLYFARPVTGAGVAFVFYLIIRGGLLAGTNADARAVNPFGLIAIAALVGMFSDAALVKLNEVFDTLFQSRDTRQQALDAPEIDAPDALPAGRVNVDYRYDLKTRGGTAPFVWASTGPLPAGLQLTAGGVLEGRPTAAATLAIAIQVTDARGRIARKECSLEIR